MCFFAPKSGHGLPSLLSTSCFVSCSCCCSSTSCTLQQLNFEQIFSIIKISFQKLIKRNYKLCVYSVHTYFSIDDRVVSVLLDGVIPSCGVLVFIR